MHNSVRGFFKEVAKFAQPGWTVIEAGSYNVNGSIRDLFDGTLYLGFDERPGPDVDRVMSAHETHRFGYNYADMVLSTSMLEHDTAPWESAASFIEWLRPGGFLAVTAPGFGWPRHEYPGDLWRFSVDSFRVLFPSRWMAELICKEQDLGEGPDVLYFGRKR